MARQKVSDNDDDAEIERAFADGTCRFALDQLLRAHGWRIERREAGREPVWRKRGRCYPEGCVVRSLPDREVADALLLETFYFDERLKGAGA